MTTPAFTVVHSTPPVETYRYLRTAAGLSPKTLEAAERGLPNTLFAVQVFCGQTAIGMGRIIGDGGTFYQVVDIAVLPEYQGQGVGKKIMTEIADYNRPRGTGVRLCQLAGRWGGVPTLSTIRFLAHGACQSWYGA